VASFEQRDSTCSRQILRNLNETADSATRRAAPNSPVNSKCTHQVRHHPSPYWWTVYDVDTSRRTPVYSCSSSLC